MQPCGWVAHASRSGLVALAATACVLPRGAAAQTVGGTILGEVKDASGAVLPEAMVSLVQAETSFARSVLTGANGEYCAPALPTGTYRVSVALVGFRKATVENVHLGVDQKARIDFRLAVGR